MDDSFRATGSTESGKRGRRPALSVRVEAAQKAERAWLARVAGGSWNQVARLVGYNDDAAAIRAVRTYFGKLPVVPVHERRELWRERLELLWKQALLDVHEQRPGAIRAGVAVAQRAAALDGLDAPQRIQVSPGGDEFEQVIALALKGAGVIEVPEANIFDAEVEEDPDTSTEHDGR